MKEDIEHVKWSTWGIILAMAVVIGILFLGWCGLLWLITRFI